MRRFLWLALVVAACDKTDPDHYSYPTGGSGSECEADLKTPEGFVDALKCAEYKSCAFDCSGCGETVQPYACPAMRGWSAVAHATACGSFDGTTMPPATLGACKASDPSGDAVATAGPDATVKGRVRLPDGHFIQPAGHEQILAAGGVTSGFPLNVALVPGTRFAVVSDSGIDDNAIEVVDLDLLAQDKPALVASVRFPQPMAVYYGLAFAPPNRVYASGGGDGVVYAMTIDAQTGALARDAAGDVHLGPALGGGSPYVGAVATSADGSSLVVVPSTGDSSLRVVDLASKKETPIDLGGATEFFDLVRDPYDSTGATYWVSSLDARAVYRVDVAQKKITATYATGKNPEGIALLGGTHLAVASSDDDTIDVFELASGKLVQTLATGNGGASGLQPGVLAYDASAKVLYATLSGVNAVGVYAFTPHDAAVLAPMGKIPSAWWPSAVRVRADGSIVVATGKGHGTGPALKGYGPGTGATSEDTRGSIQLVAPASIDLAAATTLVDASRAVPSGQPAVDCKGGASDFPIPATNKGDPSPVIKHVVYVLRENKTFDAVFGDLPGVNGDPKLVMSPGRMDEFWKNARTLAKAFAVSDNYYVDAEQSIQGHVWSAFGRSTDYVERTWTTISRGRKPKAGIDRTVGYTSAGSLFDWLESGGVPYDDLGEIVGMGKQGFDPQYPGLVYTVMLPDVEKACFVAARARAACDLKAFTFVVLPNDHTQGGTAGAPVPELMIAVNDEATGMLVDAISHSPEWPSTLIVIVEDDPQNGGDHVDSHRTPILFVSPWVKRGYVSHTHIDAASIHKIFAHVFAKPYLGEAVVDAPLPLDLFTSTPDFTPYTYAPRTTDTACNKSGTKEARVAEGWDFARPDDQPGLNEQVERRLREIAAP